MELVEDLEESSPNYFDMVLREVTLSRQFGDTTLYLIGTTTSNQVARVRVTSFPVYVLCKPKPGTSMQYTISQINGMQEHNILKRSFDTIQLRPVMGYQGDRVDTIYKVYVVKCAHVYAAKKKLEKFCHIVHKRLKTENQFLNETGLRLQQGCRVRYQTSNLPTDHLMVAKADYRDVSFLGHLETALSIAVVFVEPDAEGKLQCFLATYSSDSTEKKVHRFTAKRTQDAANIFRAHLRRHQSVFVAYFPSKLLDAILSFTKTDVYFILINLSEVLKKMMVSPPLDGYTLAHAMEHPSIFPSSYTPPSGDAVTVCGLNITALEQNNTCVINQVEFSRAAHTRIVECVERGQQVRVWNKLCMMFHKEQLYVNDDEDKKPIIKWMHHSQSCYPSSREQSLEQSNVANIGGAVQVPIPDLHVNTITAVLDFASMYPSIMESEKLCFQRLCIDSSQIDNPLYRTQTVPIHPNQCVVFITGRRMDPLDNFEDTPYLLPRLVAEVVQERARVKRALAKERDPFKRKVLDAKQRSNKVIQNAVYGFTGVNPKYAFMRCSDIMASTCAIGRYMIFEVAHLVESKFDGVVVYGDTDSVIVQFNVPDDPEHPEAVAQAIYDRCNQVCTFANTMFKAPNRLEFEGAYMPFLLSERKKMYSGFLFGPEDGAWHKTPKLVMKGYGAIKRDRCRFVRRIAKDIMPFVLRQEEDIVLTMLREQSLQLVNGLLPMTDLILRTTVKDQKSYSTSKLIQVQTLNHWQEQTGRTLALGSRLAYVVTQGDEKLYLRGREAKWAQENATPVDLQYYFNKQFVKAITPLIEHSTTLTAGFNNIINEARQVLRRQHMGAREISSYFTL